MGCGSPRDKRTGNNKIKTNKNSENNPRIQEPSVPHESSQKKKKMDPSQQSQNVPAMIFSESVTKVQLLFKSRDISLFPINSYSLRLVNLDIDLLPRLLVIKVNDDLRASSKQKVHLKKNRKRERKRKSR